MAGTGSTLVAALRAGRNSYGIELNPKYAEIARQLIAEERKLLGSSILEHDVENRIEMITGDATLATNYQLPTINYVLTSPPYWDMLHAKGAERRRNAAPPPNWTSSTPTTRMTWATCMITRNSSRNW